MTRKAWLVALAASAGLIAGCSTSANTNPPSASLAPTSASPSPTPSVSAESGTATMVMQSEFSGNMGIYLVDAAGTVGLKLSKDQTSARHPDWAPDGKTVLFDSDDDGALWLVSVDGSNPRQLLTCDTGCFGLSHAAFSPDGRRVAYVRYEPTTGSDPVNSPPSASSIRVLDLVTMKSSTVAKAKQPELFDVPRWSPDGTRLVFAIDQFGEDLGETGSTIAVVKAAGGPAKRLLPMRSWAYAPDWNRTTNLLVFSTESKDYSTKSQTGQAYDLWSIAPTGGVPTQLTQLAPGSHLVYPTWTPDGTAIIASLDAPSGPRAAVKVDPATGTITQLLSINSLHARLRP